MKILLFFTGLFYCYTSFCQDVNYLVEQGEKFEAAMNDAQAIIKYKEALKLQPQNLYIVCKCSELCSRIGGRYKSDKKKMADYYSAAKVYADIALKTDPKSSEANFVMAMVVGRTAMQKGGKEKINAVKDIRRYAELSLKYDPANFKAWHVMGKWYYEVSVLSMIEKATVRLFFGPLPKASLTDAISAFEESKKLNPAMLLNYLELAKAYKKNNEPVKANKLLKNMLTLPIKSEDDPAIISEGSQLLKKWN